LRVSDRSTAVIVVSVSMTRCYPAEARRKVPSPALAARPSTR
jgi:hypothetical protein